MREHPKCSTLLQKIAVARQGHRLHQGQDKLTHTWTDGTKTMLQGLRSYTVGRDGGRVYRHKNGKKLLCLPIGDPFSYQALYNAARAWSAANNNTKNVRLINTQLNKMFDCPATLMTRNMNWNAPDLNNISGFFELLAFLDLPLDETNEDISERFKNSGLLDQQLFDSNNNVNESIVERFSTVETLLTTVEKCVEVVEKRGEVVEKRVEVVEKRVEVVEESVHAVKESVQAVKESVHTVEESVNARVDTLEEVCNARFDEIEKRMAAGEDKENSASSSNGILRETHMGATTRRLRFDDRAIRTKLVPSRFNKFNNDMWDHPGSNGGCLHISYFIKINDHCTLGVMDSSAGGALGILHGFESLLPKGYLSKEEQKEHQHNKAVPFGENGSDIVVLGRPSVLNFQNICLKNEDEDFPGGKYIVSLVLVDWRQEADGTFTARALCSSKLNRYIAANPNLNSILPGDLFLGRGHRVAFDQVTIIGQGLVSSTNKTWETSSIGHGTFVRASVNLFDKARAAVVLGPSAPTLV